MLCWYAGHQSTLAAALAAVKLSSGISCGGRQSSGHTKQPGGSQPNYDGSCLQSSCGTERCKKQPNKENLEYKAHVVGNIMYDSYLHFADRP